MSKPTQATRHIAIHTPLGDDVLLLQRFSAREEVSRLFEIDLDLLSEDDEINFDDIIGQNVTISMELPGGGKRYWNGFINCLKQGVSTSRKFAQYKATMVPWLWFLTLTSDCRIFQEKSVPDIVKQVFNDLGFSDIEDRLSPGYRKRNYCVQYRETDFNFVSRLMEQEGIYYYFSHEQGKCTIVLCDSLSKHDPYDNYGEISFTPDTKSTSLQERISDWAMVKQVLTGKFAHTDYNFTKPSTSLMSNEEDQKQHAKADYEIYDYPGEYPEKSDGDKYAKLRMEELAHGHEVCTGQSDSRGICSGYKYTMTRHTREDQNREYLILSTNYQAAAEDYETSGGQGEMCACAFTVIPSSVQYRPERKTPKPVIQGTQTAVVTGPSGEEIYTDEYGRVKVQFHWDREGKKDENSSCWIRVSQAWAGQGWASMHIPHVGHEVVVDFLEGDPDRPIITGRVYNGNNMPAHSLPDNKTKSVFRDHGGNHIIMEGEAGKEQIHMYSPYGESKFSIGAPNNGPGLFGSTELDLTLNIDRDRIERVGRDLDMQILRNEMRQIQGNLQEQIHGHHDQELHANWNTICHGEKVETVFGPVKLKWDGVGIKIHGGATSDTFLGAKNTNFYGPIAIDSYACWKRTYNVSGEYKRSAGYVIQKGTAKTIKDMDDNVKIDSAVKTEVVGGGGAADTSKMTLDGSKIKIKCGSSYIEIKKDGDIRIQSNGKTKIISDGQVYIESKNSGVNLKGAKDVHVAGTKLKHKNLCVEK